MNVVRLAGVLLSVASSLAAQSSILPLVVRGLEPTAPVRLTAEVRGTKLHVHATVRPEWHMYGRDTGGGQPVQIEIEKDSAFVADGALVTPMDQSGKVTGVAEITLPLRQPAKASTLRAKMRFIACDALTCLPPMEVTIASPAVLLVVIKKDERADRISSFLTERGFYVDVTTYEAAKQAECDAHDVVLADSPTFGQAKGVRALVQKFPETSSPLVAVNFGGSQLLESQKIAMACGYI